MVGILFLLGIVGWFLTRGEPCEDCTLVGVVNAETIVVTSPTRKDFRVWFKSDASPLVTMHPALAGELTRLFRAGKVDARLHSPMMDEDGVQTYRGTEVTISDEPVASKMAYVVQQLAEYEAKRRAQD